MTENRFVSYVKEGAIVRLTIDRPTRRNSLNWGAVEQLIDGLRLAAGDNEVRVVVLSGTGDRAFSSGGDMRDMSGAQRKDNGGAPPFAKLLSTMYAFPKPLLGRINGDALGGGFGIALLCDMAIAADTARFGAPEIRLGMFPWMIMPLLAAHVGPKKLTEMALYGGKLSADEALRMELVNKVVPSSELDACCDEWAKKITGACPPVIAKAMPNMRRIRYPNLPALLAEQQDHFLWNLEQPELFEGVGAFLEKRAPNWVI